MSIAFHKDDHGMAAIEKRGMSLTHGTFNKIDIQPYEVFYKTTVNLIAMAK